MDKRTLLFVFLIGISFIGFNLYLSHEQDKRNRTVLEQKAIAKAKQEALDKFAAEKKKEKPEALPLVQLSSDPQGQSVVATGIVVGDSILTLGWKHPLPETIYANGKNLTLQTKNAIEGGPVLYSGPSFSSLDIASVPSIGSYDVQLVTFPGGSQTPNVTYAQYKDGTLYFPLGPVMENGIGLYKTNKGYLPLGFYDGVSSVFVEMPNLPALTGLTKAYLPPQPPISRGEKEQKFYVLENAYMQLVFTNVGGAIAEINLPFQGKQDSKSVVKEIEFDREIAKESPNNARFPMHPYLASGSQETQTGKVGGYYPLLRRGTIGKKSHLLSPQYYALNIVSEYPEMAEMVYEVKEFTDTTLVFEATQPHRKITKTFTLSPEQSSAPYIFNATIKVEGDSRGLWVTSGIPEVEIMSNSSSPQIQYRLSRKGKSEVEKLDLPKAKETVTVSSVMPDWVVNSNGYLGIILDPLSELSGGFRANGLQGETVPTRLAVIDPVYHPFPASKYPGYEVLIPLPTKGGESQFRVYAGPFEENTLKTVDKIYSDPSIGYNPDYIACRSFYGWFSFISEPFAKFLFVVMRFFYTLTHSWAFSIILLTVFLRILLYPLNTWSIKSMRRMQQLSPQIQAIQQKYKKDPKKSQMEIMNLYREKKVNPFMGCLPILIQIPFLIGMFDLLKSSFQLRGAVFIPGWIDDLTAPDVLFQWQRPIFFIGNQFHLLPILLGIVMFFQQRLSSTAPKDPSQMTDQQRQQRAMGTIMTVVFTVMFYHFPSGLNLYWLSSMILGMGQQWLTNRLLDKKKDEKTIEVKGKKLASKK